jgi:hypothetical protein
MFERRLVTATKRLMNTVGWQSRVLTISKIYPLTPWNRAFIQKLTVAQLVKKFSTFYGTRRFINVPYSQEPATYPM